MQTTCVCVWALAFSTMHTPWLCNFGPYFFSIDASHACFAQFQGQTVLVGVDDMDLFKGIELKLMAVERVLDHHPEWRGKLVLIQVTNAPRLVIEVTTYSTLQWVQCSGYNACQDSPCHAVHVSWHGLSWHTCHSIDAQASSFLRVHGCLVMLVCTWLLACSCLFVRACLSCLLVQCLLACA